MSGINIIGMPFGMHGLGMELRDKALAMVAEGIDVCIVNQNYSSLKREIRDPRIEALVTAKPQHEINLICHNLPATNLIARKNPELLEGRYNIGAPYWEFPQLPESHLEGLAQLDEIWVSNSFLKTCFSPHTDKPIVQLPLHLDAAPNIFQRATNSNPLVFGYVFDFNSMAARKDPMLLLIAFMEAFADKPNAKVKLVIKYKYEPSHTVQLRDVADLIAVAELDDRIQLIGSALSPEEMTALSGSFDVYVSPHRAEGLGRGIIEAIINSKAVAATGYSGPAEFLSTDYSVPLEYYQSHVGAAALGDIKSHFTWAEVQIESLITALKAFADTPNLAVEFGKKAREALLRSHGRKKHGEACLARLKELDAS